MDHAIQSSFTYHQLRLINACRLFLGVTLMSDIASADGRFIRAGIFQLDHHLFSAPCNLLPYQSRPGLEAIRVWKHFLFTLTYHRLRSLRQPLWQWLHSGNATYRSWTHYYHPPTLSLYEHQGAIFMRYFSPDNSEFLCAHDASPTLPASAVLADVTRRQGKLFLLAFQPATKRLSSPVVSCFSTWVQTLLPWEAQLLAQTTFYPSVEAFTGHFSQPGATLVVCSDGSAPDFVGTYGATCCLSDGTTLATLSGPAPGFRTSSFRAEGHGVLAVLRLIFCSCEYTSIPLPAGLTIYTDSLSTIITATRRLSWLLDFPYTTMSAAWDVHQAITSTLRSFPSPHTFCHVKGHQDSRAGSSLLFPATLNVEADRLAGAFQYPATVSSTRAPMICGVPASLHGPSGTISSNYRQTLRRLCSENDLRQYICNKYEWPSEVFDSISWTEHGQVFLSLYHRRHFLTKFIHGWLLLGKLQRHYGHHYLASCPACHLSLKDHDHFLCCPTTSSWRRPLFDELTTFWITHHADPTLQAILLDCLRSWLSSEEYTHPTYSPCYCSLIQDLSTVGYDHLFYGRFVHSWILLQDSYASQLAVPSSEFSGGHFVRETISIIWDNVYKLWNLRNQHNHGVDAATREAAALAAAQRETSELYQLRHLIKSRDREVFYPTIDEHFAAEPTSIGLRHWLTTWKPVLLKSVERSRKSGLHRFHSIRQFFASS